MKKEELELFLDKRVKVVKQTDDGKAFIYTGTLIKLNDESLLLLDTYDKHVVIAYFTITEVIELGGGNK